MVDSLVSFDIALPQRFNNNRHSLSRLAWYEGLQLLPQHFQAMDDRVDGCFSRQVAAASQPLWGLDQLTVDELALHSGQLRINFISGQFPDGTVFVHDERHNGKLELSIPSKDEKLGQERCFAVAMPLDDFTVDGREDISRYRQMTGDMLEDKKNQSNKAAVTRWVPNLRISEFNPGEKNFSQIPFIKMRMSPNGWDVIPYHAPAVRLSKQSDCFWKIVQLVKSLRSKAMELNISPLPASLKSNHQMGLMPIFSALIANLPRLEAQLSANLDHPYHVFLSLCDLAGALSGVVGLVPEKFPLYDHTDLAGSILPVVNYIHEVVKRIHIQDVSWSEKPFTLAENRWNCQMSVKEDEVLCVRLTFRISDSDASIQSWIKHALMCWDVQEVECNQLRIRGLRRNLEAAPEQLGLPVTPNQRFIAIQSGQRIGKNLIIYAPDAHAQIGVVAIHVMSAPSPVSKVTSL